MSYLQKFNFAWGVYIFSVRSVQRSGDFWKGSGTPGMAGEENSSMAGSGFFPEFPPRGMGW